MTWLNKIIFIFCLCSSLYASAQQNRRNTPQKFIPIPAAGYYWQGLGTFELGLRVVRYTGRYYHETVSLTFGTNLFVQADTYAAPDLTFKYYRPVLVPSTKGLLGVTAGASYWLFNTLHAWDHRITPEAGLSFSLINISYGYNIPLSYEAPFMGRHRIALRLAAF